MLSPLRFKPLFRQYIWGGRRLQTVLGKEIGEGDDYAESWEVVDHGKDQSVVQFGEHAGLTLHDLVTRYGEQLLGIHHPQQQFPLLFKFLDANRNLSVQVHPNDEQGARLQPPDAGKTEAWVILEAVQGSKIYAGLRNDVNRNTFVQAVKDNRIESCLHVIEPKIGDCLFIPAGTVHALGNGLVVAEIQQASDTTFRIFDWNRVGSDGCPRQLHIQAAMSVIDFEMGPIHPQMPMPTDHHGISRLVESDKFVLDRWSFNQPQYLPDTSRCQILMVVSGSVHVENDPAKIPLGRGDTMLIPACAKEVRVEPRDTAVLLRTYLP